MTTDEQLEQLEADNAHLRAVTDELLLHARQLGEHIRVQMNSLLQVVHHSTEIYQQHANYIYKLEKRTLDYVSKDEDPTITGI